MNRKSWAETLWPIEIRFAGVVIVTVFAVVAMTAGFDLGNHDRRAAKSEFITSRMKLGALSFYYPGQSEVKYFTLELKNANVSTLTSDLGNFLEDPVGRLRQQGIAVPTASESHWKALTASLRRLANPTIPSSSTERAAKDNPNLKNEIVRLQIPGGWISVAGDLYGGGNSFLTDPVNYLRAQGVNVRSADEPAWRQLAAALKALRREYANSRVNTNLERQNSTNSEFTATKPKTRIGIGLPTKQATQGQLAREIRQQLISRGVTVGEQEVQATATRALDLITKAKDPEKGVIYVHTRKFTFCVSWGKNRASCNNQ